MEKRRDFEVEDQIDIRATVVGLQHLDSEGDLHVEIYTYSGERNYVRINQHAVVKSSLGGGESRPTR